MMGYRSGSRVHPDARIGDGTVIGPGCWIGPHVVIGQDCIVKPGAVIGGDGFGYERDEQGVWQPKPHHGRVVLLAGTHVGANTCIDRGSYRDTMIGPDARIDNLVHVAHNVVIEGNVMVIACAEISGSCWIKEGAWIGPSAAIKEHVTVGVRALVGIGAVVIGDVAANTTVAGVPARVINEHEGVRERM